MLQMLEMAERVLDGARRVSEGSRQRSEAFVYQNLSYALELSLKAFVQANGWNDDRCRREIRHDLVKAHRAAESAGLRGLDAETTRLLAILTPVYANHSIEEFVAGGSLGLDASRSLRLAEELLSGVREALER